MVNSYRSLRVVFSTLCAALITSATNPAFCGILLPTEEKRLVQSISPDMELSVTAGLDANNTSQRISRAIQRGWWTRACSIATDALAGQESNIDALGVFSVCQSLVANQDGSARALSRLREVEPPPGYYAMLTQGVAHLRNGSIDMAEVEFTRVLGMRSADPLAAYFLGEALHARHKDTDAIVSFKRVLKIWPDYAPALSAVAQLTAAKSASRQDMNVAIAMSEHAALVEPMNLKYWKQTADLCDRAGQHDRAKAIRLQWLTRLSPPAK